jgi:hypothetical protein
MRQPGGEGGCAGVCMHWWVVTGILAVSASTRTDSLLAGYSTSRHFNDMRP